MRLVSCWLMFIAATLVALRAVGQSTSEPTLLPPPITASPDEQAASSAPWQPPAAVSVPMERLPIPPAEFANGSADGAIATRDIVVDEPPWFERTFWLGPAPWDSGVELGLNGSSGTEESFSLRTGGYIKRNSRFSKLNLTTDYNRTTTSGKSTQDNAQFDVRNDWLLDEASPWTLFATTNAFYDKFQAFDLQMSVNTGVGYRFVHEPGFEFMGRFGGGTSREFGGPDDRWVPESLLGMEYAQQLTQTQKFYGKLDYYPEWDQLGEYRMVADTGWEIELVQPSNLSLKISATDRYDSTPNGANPHLVNYSVLLLLKL